MQLDKVFSLHSGNLQAVKNAIDHRQNTVVFHTAFFNRLHIASGLNRQFLYVTSDLVTARAAHQCLQQYCKGDIAIMSEREDVLIARKNTNYNLLQQRMDVLYSLVQNKLQGLIITVDALMQLYPTKQLFANNIIDIAQNSTIDLSTLAENLIVMGYSRVDEVDAVGTFSIRGDIFDIFVSGQNLPIRINVFGDEIESMYYFNTDTMLSQGKIEQITIYPITDILVSHSSVNSVLNEIRKAKRNSSIVLDEKISLEMERFANKPSDPLNSFLLPFLRPFMGSIYEYLNQDAVIIFDDTKQIEDKIKVSYNYFLQRIKTMHESNLCLKQHKQALLSGQELAKFDHTLLGFGRITSQVSMFVPQQVFSIKTQALPAFYNNMPAFFDQIKALIRNGATIRIYVKDTHALDALKNTLNEQFIGVESGDKAQASLAILIGNISHGFIYPQEKLALIGINDLTKKVSLSKNLAQKRQVFVLPNKGDFVVHDIHGIGISMGMQCIKTINGNKDFYVILYKDGDTLYLPADQLDTVEKYNGVDTPTLHRLGGAEFEKVKQRVKSSIKAMTIDLLALYQARHQKKGHVYQADTVWQKEMENDFEFTETDDQLIAINEIKQDMESGKIMDRLLCGDVGFGKTEVALRAIFKTVIENKQAAILAPTTILAQQHYNLIKARLNKFGLKIDLLSRFVPPKEITNALQRIKSGQTNIVVATHRILSKDVQFFDLGLLVLDEEQRFGVEHKEKLKVFRNAVNILSLSATPIPRTLHMALSGIRDISTLEIPPKNRLPIETYVTEYNDNLLVDAIQKELNRGGQAFILYNKVRTIEKFYRHVCSLFDDSVNIIFAHGQMDEITLEDRIKDFYDNKAQVLISTTIIENGIDLPNANTLFVLDADMLGLSQLYQLRGRVGRSDVASYAYFTVPPSKVLTANATKRLDALMDNTALGSGFAIAMRDLEIRGAGNLMGREQHGQMEKVGYEMYLKLVKEGIDELQGKPTVQKRDVELKIDGNYALDENYITSSKDRVSFYRRISSLITREEGQQYYDSLKNIYGKPPTNISNIIRLGIIKNLAQKWGVSKINITKSGVGIFFYDTSILTNERFFAAIESHSKVCVLCTDPPSVVFDHKNMGMRDKIKLILNFLLYI